MKHVILLYDGMSDVPVPALGNRTPMQAAHKPLLDSLAGHAELGRVQTVPGGLKPGSDVANLSVLGYDPKQYYTGRSPLEAISMGVPMTNEDLSLRCNLVTLSETESVATATMLDYSGGDIQTAEATELLAAIEAALGKPDTTFFAGVQYRHCLLLRGAAARRAEFGTLTPPHDISDVPVRTFLPQDPTLLALMEQSYTILKDHPINQARRAAGKRPANGIWLWGEGTRPAMPLFSELWGLQGSVISAVDLLRGIGTLAGMATPVVPGATGWLDTNYQGKAACAIEQMQRGQDFIFLHFEATDEAGHRGDIAGKVRGIEHIDEQVLPPLLAYLQQQGSFALLALPDHATPLHLKTHTSDAVPFLLYRSAWQGSERGASCFCEESAAAANRHFNTGPELLAHFLTAS